MAFRCKHKALKSKECGFVLWVDYFSNFMTTRIYKRYNFWLDIVFDLMYHSVSARILLIQTFWVIGMGVLQGSFMAPNLFFYSVWALLLVCALLCIFSYLTRIISLYSSYFEKRLIWIFHSQLSTGLKSNWSKWGESQCLILDICWIFTKSI